MKKVLVIVLAVMLVMASFALTGCGSDTDTDQAREYMDKADVAATVMLETAGELDQSMSVIIGAAAAGDMSLIDTTTVATSGKGMETLIAEVDDIKVLYEKILPLEGVDDYVDYANAMISFLDAQKQVLEVGKQLFNQISPAIMQWMQTGDPSTAQAAIQQAGAPLGAIEELQGAADTAYEQAQSISLSP